VIDGVRSTPARSRPQLVWRVLVILMVAPVLQLVYLLAGMWEDIRDDFAPFYVDAYRRTVARWKELK
jgi:hypothetical protein